METLTKEQRHEVYKEALKIILNAKLKGFREFLCVAIRDSLVYKFAHEDFDAELIFKMGFEKELLKHKPIDASYAWWDGNKYDVRINVLNNCIEETKP